MIKFGIDNVKVDGGKLESKWDYLTRIVGDVHVLVDGKLFYQEKEFCVVEFATFFARWLSDAKPSQKACYESIESEQSELFCFMPSHDGWKVFSIHQQFESTIVISIDLLTAAFRVFVQDLNAKCISSLNVNVLTFLKQEITGIERLLR